MLPVLFGMGIVAASAVASKHQKLTKKGKRSLPSVPVLPKPVTVNLKQQLDTQSELLADLAMVYVYLAQRIDRLEEENTYKVTIH